MSTQHASPRQHLGLAALVAATLSGGCWRSHTPPDAGPVDAVDANASDAGTSDAQIDDAELDAGYEDAGEEDLGPLPCVPEPETCNGHDDDCDGVSDEEPEATTWCGAPCGMETCPRARPITPLSGSLLTSSRPTFRWALEGGADGAHLELCRDRACGDVVVALDGTTEATPVDSLPRGVLFWRLVPQRAGIDLPAISSPWIAHIPSVSRALDRTTGTVLDFNGDGKADVLVHGKDRNGFGEWSLFVSSPGALALTARLPGSTDIEAVGDFDGDGRTDLLETLRPVWYRVWYGAPGGLRETAPVPGTLLAWPSVHPAIAADFDRDGYADVLGGVHIARGGRRGLDGTSVELPLPVYAEPSFRTQAWPIGDVDGDGAADVAFGQYCDDGSWSGPGACPTDIALWHGSLLAVPQLWTPRPPEGPAALLAAGDVDGDALLDHIAWFPEYRSADLSHSYLLRGAEASAMVSRWNVIPGIPDWADRLNSDTWLGPACDVDGDGYGDMIFRREGIPLLRRGGPSGLSATVQPITDEPAYGARCLGDDDGDGYQDVALYVYPPYTRPATAGPGELRVYRGTAGGLDPTPAQVITIPRALGGRPSSPSLY